MSKTSSIFQALNESRETPLKKRKNEANDPAPADTEDLEKVCECGVEYPDGAKFCPGCGAAIGANKDMSENDEDDLVDDLEDEDPDDEGEEIELTSDEDDDPDDDEDEDPDDDEDEDDTIEISKYNEDTVAALESVLKRAKAPAPIMKAYESKMYERCAFWLESKKGISIDLSEGFTKNESAKIRKHLTAIKAPRAICEAFDRGQHSLVAAYLKTRK